jgi:hypothetical protein
MGAAAPKNASPAQRPGWFVLGRRLRTSGMTLGRSIGRRFGSSQLRTTRAGAWGVVFRQKYRVSGHLHFQM